LRLKETNAAKIEILKGDTIICLPTERRLLLSRAFHLREMKCCNFSTCFLAPSLDFRAPFWAPSAQACSRFGSLSLRLALSRPVIYPPSNFQGAPSRIPMKSPVERACLARASVGGTRLQPRFFPCRHPLSDRAALTAFRECLHQLYLSKDMPFGKGDAPWMLFICFASPCAAISLKTVNSSKSF
jgi:hypothetical protein